jgi:MFS transporter, SP family, sugar:H+ symporter
VHENQAIWREVEDVHNQVELEKNLSAGWLECFRPNRKTLYRTLLGMTLQSLQQLTGANYCKLLFLRILSPIQFI